MRIAIILFAALAAIACKKEEPTITAPDATGEIIDNAAVDAAVAVEPEPEPAAAPRVATAELVSAKGKKVTGTVTFREEDGKVTVEAKIDGLTGTHGFHVHQNGACDQPDFKSAGDHFSPEPHPHAGPADDKRHAGDLGNIEGKKGETTNHTASTDRLSLADGAANSVVGKAVVVHEKADDLKTQPSGNSGARVACGIVKLSEGEGAGATGTTDGGAAPAAGGDASGAAGEPHEHKEGDGHKH